MTSKKSTEPTLAEVMDKYGWYVMKAMRQKIDGMQKSVDDAKRSLATRVDVGIDAREHSMRAMIEEVERMIAEYKPALEALKAVGVR